MRKFIFLLIIFLILPVFVFAGPGVGVNTGKIYVDAPLKPGGIYNLPIIGVSNTGDQQGKYEMAVTFLSNQPEMRPAKEWFIFSPSSFYLEPGEVEQVSIKLILPVKMRPGDYFAFLEAHPIAEAGPGTTIGVAAATKLYFKVVPSNIIEAFYYRVSSFFRENSPWSWIILGIILGAIVLTILRKHFAFKLGIQIKKK